jgi:hypothetical protein
VVYDPGQVAPEQMISILKKSGTYLGIVDQK